MQLHQKFSLLALIYVLSLTANLVMSSWCIVIYFQSAFHTFQADLAKEQEIDHVQSLLRRQRALLEDNKPGSAIADEYESIERRISEAMSQLETENNTEPIADIWSAIKQAIEHKKLAAAQRFGSEKNLAQDHMTGDLGVEAFTELDGLLSQASAAFLRQRQRSVVRAADTQQHVVTILKINTACGAFLCVLGLIFVRRWVVRPVADLREAAKQIGTGNFSYRIKPRSSDELGQLAGEVNQMASTIVEMQSKLIEQERLAAAGEMVNRLAHNIRNPLAGIRGLAEATARRYADQAETVECQQRIIDTVDKFEKWLRDLLESVSPMTLNLQRVCINELIEQVVTALRPMLDRHRVDVRIEIDPAMREVQLDSLHFEQALVALVTNAVQASREGQIVRARAAPVGDKPGQWHLSIEDDGPGVPPELREKIFMPYFTTKRNGNGVGLAIANKVVKTHGGWLTLDSEMGRGCRFIATMPGLVTEV